MNTEQKLHETLRALLDLQNGPPQSNTIRHVGDSKFESWFSTYDPSGKGDKQRARDAYAAGLGDQPAPDVAELCSILKEADRELQACQAVLWNLERDGIDPAYGKGAREAQVKIKTALAKHEKGGAA